MLVVPTLGLAAQDGTSPQRTAASRRTGRAAGWPRSVRSSTAYTDLVGAMFQSGGRSPAVGASGFPAPFAASLTGSIQSTPNKPARSRGSRPEAYLPHTPTSLARPHRYFRPRGGGDGGIGPSVSSGRMRD